MKQPFIICTVCCALISLSTFAQEPDSVGYKHFLGSTLFMLGNFLPNPPHYYQLNYGYRFTPQDVLSVEAITWTYPGPLGRPYGPEFENPNSNFPGTVQAIGAGLAYKRFLWRRAYAQVHATAFRQHYRDEFKVRIQSGFQLFCVFRLGYQFRFWKQRVFLEPSVAVTSWPINSNLPASFQIEEDKWPSYFLFEPGLHVGLNF